MADKAEYISVSWKPSTLHPIVCVIQFESDVCSYKLNLLDYEFKMCSFYWSYFRLNWIKYDEGVISKTTQKSGRKIGNFISQMIHSWVISFVRNVLNVYRSSQFEYLVKASSEKMKSLWEFFRNMYYLCFL